MEHKTIRDAVHGDITATGGELRIVDTVAFQRLRGIKQLGTAHLVYPSATHTRFEHSLGACWMAKRILRSIEENGTSPRVPDEVQRLICAGALLHDITHVPFGHTFEDERHILERHDESAERFDYFLSQPDISAAVSGQPSLRSVLGASAPSEVFPPYVREMISGTVCADLLDYLKRDACCCGLSQDYDERLFRYFRIVDGHLTYDLHQGRSFRPDALSELVNLLRLRYNLTERVYYHHAKISSGAMVSKALELALKHERIGVGELYDLRDDTFLYLLRERCADLQPVTELLDDLAARRLFVRTYQLTLDTPEQEGISAEQQQILERRFHYNTEGERERVERDIEVELGLPEGSVLIYCPSTRMALKEAEVLVRLHGDRVVPLSQLDLPEVEVLTDQHRNLWKFHVLLRRRFEDSRERCAEVCRDLIGRGF